MLSLERGTTSCRRLAAAAPVFVGVAARHHNVRLASATDLPGRVDRGSCSVAPKTSKRACRVPGQSRRCSTTACDACFVAFRTVSVYRWMLLVCVCLCSWAAVAVPAMRTGMTLTGPAKGSVVLCHSAAVVRCLMLLLQLSCRPPNSVTTSALMISTPRSVSTSVCLSVCPRLVPYRLRGCKNRPAPFPGRMS